MVETVTAQKAPKRITFEALPDKTYGDPAIAVNALASSGLPTTVASSGLCTAGGAIVALRPFRLSAKAFSGVPVFFRSSGHCAVTGSTVRLTAPGS